MSSDHDDFKKAAARLWARVTQPYDQNLSMVRDEYLRLDTAKRTEFRKWVEKLAEIEAPRGGVDAKAKIHISVPGADDYEILILNVRPLLRALTAWDNGEDFSPTKLGDVF